MDKRLNQIVVDLAKAMVGKTQQVQPRRSRRHTLQFIDRIELDQRRVILAAFIGNVCRCEKGLGELMQGWKNFRRSTSRRSSL